MAMIHEYAKLEEFRGLQYVTVFSKTSFRVFELTVIIFFWWDLNIQCHYLEGGYYRAAETRRS